MTLDPCADSEPAEWLRTQNREWYDLTARGPLGYERYARLRFIPDPSYVGQREMDADIPDEVARGPSETWQIAVAVSRLVKHTGTPDQCYYLFWEGWPDTDYQDAGRMELRDSQFEASPVIRGYYLFSGDANLFEWEEPSVDGASAVSEMPVPAFVWPADRAWCIVGDVDPHFAGIGGSTAAIADVLADPQIDTV